jgi:hypothetical protein
METDSPPGAPRRPRARLNRRRTAAPVAALAIAALLAGCGTASSSGSGGSTTGGKAATSTNQFNPNLVPAGGSSPGTPPKSGQKKAAQKAGSKAGAAGRTGPGASGGSTGPGSGSGGSGTGRGGAGGGLVAGPGAPVSQTRTVTVTHTDTVTHTVTQTKYVRPNVPSGAGLPSRSPALSVSRFDAAGGNIGCRISGGSVRCDVARRVWSPPRKPASCHAAWGQGLMIGSSGASFFVCARSSVLDPTGTYIKPGYDDKVGSVTCQVRRFGVTCFESDGRGFFVGRTGYTRF